MGHFKRDNCPGFVEICVFRVSLKRTTVPPLNQVRAHKLWSDIRIICDTAGVPTLISFGGNKRFVVLINSGAAWNNCQNVNSSRYVKKDGFVLCARLITRDASINVASCQNLGMYYNATPRQYNASTLIMQVQFGCVARYPNKTRNGESTNAL